MQNFGIEMTASDESCRAVWQSYGVATEVLLWLTKEEATLAQILNRFWYDKAVSRVQTRLLFLQPPISFTMLYEPLFTQTLFRYDPRESGEAQC